MNSGRPGDIAADAAGNAYITGETNSDNFPVTADAADGTYGAPGLGGQFPPDVFLTRLSPTGALVYSTYLGGTDDDFGKGIAVDSSGNAYVTGFSQSSELEGFPQTANAFDGTLGGTQDAFLTKYNAAGVVVYSTFVGGTAGEGDTAGQDTGAVAADNAGNAYLTGVTYSSGLSRDGKCAAAGQRPPPGLTKTSFSQRSIRMRWALLLWRIRPIMAASATMKDTA